MFETTLFHTAVGGGALWLLLISLLMETKNLPSLLFFRFAPLLLGLGLAAIWFMQMRLV